MARSAVVHGVGSRTRRIYLSLGADGLRELAAGNDLQVPVAYAVTAAVRAAFPQDDEEELEDDALYTAAADAAAGPYAIVAAAEVPSNIVTEGDDFSVRLSARIAARSVVSVHCTEHRDEETPELLWYDTSEVDDLVVRLR